MVVVHELIRTSDNHDVTDCTRQVAATCVVHVEIQRPQNTWSAALTRCTNITTVILTTLNTQYHTDNSSQDRVVPSTDSKQCHFASLWNMSNSHYVLNGIQRGSSAQNFITMTWMTATLYVNIKYGGSIATKCPVPPQPHHNRFMALFPGPSRPIASANFSHCAIMWRWLHDDKFSHFDSTPACDS